MSNRYLNLRFMTMDIQVKLDDEGVVLDIFDEQGELLDTTMKSYEDFGVKTLKFEEDNCFHCGEELGTANNDCEHCINKK